MIAPVQTVELVLPAPDLHEIRRYCACPQGFDDLIVECIAELQPLSCRVCYCEQPIFQTPDGLNFDFAVTNSQHLQKALAGCDRILLFAATVGLLPDRLITKYNRVDPVKALFVHGVATERVEALCDAFYAERKQAYAAQNAELRARFSPGYGDLPLSMQKPIFTALDCTRLLGITLTESLLMMPSKSVTAIAGIRNSNPSAF